jgi:hypothetical protein
MASEEDAIRNVRQVVWRAVGSLATGTGTIQERLESAAITLTTLSRPGPESLSAELNGKLDAIVQDLTRTPAQGDEGKIRAALRTMSDEEGSKLAERIF